MPAIKLFLSKALKGFVDEQVAERGHVSSSEYLCGLIGRERDRQRLRGRLLEGAGSSFRGPADTSYFAALRARLRVSAEENAAE